VLKLERVACVLIVDGHFIDALVLFEHKVRPSGHLYLKYNNYDIVYFQRSKGGE